MNWRAIGYLAWYSAPFFSVHSFSMQWLIETCKRFVCRPSPTELKPCWIRITHYELDGDFNNIGARSFILTGAPIPPDNSIIEGQHFVPVPIACR
jgi:hypothetical protein